MTKQPHLVRPGDNRNHGRKPRLDLPRNCDLPPGAPSRKHAHWRLAMEFGYFAMPSHPPERGLKAGVDWDLQTMRWLDELGYSEAWIGEHHTAPWEPHPAPDLLIAQALLQTKRLRIGPGGFLLPYHHPAELANRVAMLDHMSERPADVRRCRVRTAERLGDVQCRRDVRGKPGHDSRGAGYHPAPVERRAVIPVSWQILERRQAGTDVRRPAALISSRCSSRTRRSGSPGCRRTPTRSRWRASMGSCR